MQVRNVSAFHASMSPRFNSFAKTIKSRKLAEIEKYRQYFKEVCMNVDDINQKLEPVVVIGKHIYRYLSIQAREVLQNGNCYKSHLARKALYNKSLELINKGRVSGYYSLDICPRTKKVYFVDPTDVGTTRLPKIYNDVTHMSLYPQVITDIEKACK